MPQLSCRSTSPSLRDPARVATSALAGGTDLPHFHDWWEERARLDQMTVSRIALNDLAGWRTDAVTGDLRHQSGRFFTVEGLDIQERGERDVHWTQPVIRQPEIGTLGILVKEIDGILHCLMQAKNEPGNVNGLQLSPTVQATRSNYGRVHGGKAVPYIEWFQRARPYRVISDVLQSELGGWCYRKSNRNMVVEVEGDIEPLDGFRWLTVGQIQRLLTVPDLVNMDARTVLACLPYTGLGVTRRYAAVSAFSAALARSLDEANAGLHTMDEMLHWITEARSRHDVATRGIPLNDVSGWKREHDVLAHESGAFFTVMGVAVWTGNREVSHWTQPMIEPVGLGLSAFLVREFAGVLHVLVRAQPEPGTLTVVELGPTVQCAPGDLAAVPTLSRPHFLDAVQDAAQDRIRFDTIHSEEGGRFHHARTRYMIVETDDLDQPELPPGYLWLTLSQLGHLLRHSHYLNVQARSLFASLASLVGGNTP
ncbi:NDP-hexose 2,3-dehydratase family protein [Nonomuraea sp. NPDC048916]|uniref:NDP-hexose 2,3-dehydratase family protein n=1 Tax=Nonomuraea sp. NPDC048916 TaxID=3154232 RepID=UPI0033D86C7A